LLQGYIPAQMQAM